MPKKKKAEPLVADPFQGMFTGLDLGEDDASLKALGGYQDGDDDEEDPNNPLKDVKYVGKFEPDAKVELNAMQQAFKDRAKKEQQRFELATDSEYWVCLCFLTREQKNAVLVALGLEADEKYIDGRGIAKKLGIKLPQDPRFSKPKVDQSWFGNLGTR